MKTTYKILITSIACFSINSCGEKTEQTTTEQGKAPAVITKTHESLSEETITHLQALSDTLATITDQKSATIAAPKLSQIGARFNMLGTDRAKLGPPTAAEVEQMKQKYGSQMKELNTTINTTMNKLRTSNPEAFAAVGKIMKSMMQ